MTTVARIAGRYSRLNTRIMILTFAWKWWMTIARPHVVSDVAVDRAAFSHYIQQLVDVGILSESMAYEDVVYLDAIDYADNYFLK